MWNSRVQAVKLDKLKEYFSKQMQTLKPRGWEKITITIKL